MARRRFVAVFIAGTVLGCAQEPAEQAAPPDAEPTVSFEDTADPLAAGLTITFEGIKDTERGPLARFRLRNARAEAIQYSGYAVDYPRTRIDQLNGTVWEEWSADWCGTGASYYAVPVGGSVEFSIGGVDRLPRPFRIGVYCKDATVWSDTIVIAPN